ncbi:MAG: LuxR C-terminal-related transcriptional regulator [Solirubrobacteraceae bacterium]
MNSVLRVLIAEPDAPTRAGIRLALEAEGFEICAEPVDASTATEIAVRERPDVCLIDEDLSGGALVAVDSIYRRLPSTKLVILTESEEPKSLFAGVRAGAAGYVRKDLDPARLPATIRGVVDGEAALSRRLTFHVLETLRTRERGRSAPTTPGGPSMTDRELEVLELMTEGLSTSQISGRLAIAEVTVRRHVSAAVAKLGVADRAAAIAVLTGRSRV